MKIYLIQKYHLCEKDYVMYGLNINPRRNIFHKEATFWKEEIKELG